MNTRRQFLITAPLGMLGAAAACRGAQQRSPGASTASPTPGRRVPHGITLIARLFDEGTIGRTGLTLEQAFGVARERLPGF